MNTNFYRDVDILLKRAITASIVAFVVFGGVAAWQYVSTERIAARIEQAQQTAARASDKKLASLEREVALDAAANAFAEQQAQAEAEEQARTEAQRAEPPSHG
jgi:hypothetical protein